MNKILFGLIAVCLLAISGTDKNIYAASNDENTVSPVDVDTKDQNTPLINRINTNWDSFLDELDHSNLTNIEPTIGTFLANELMNTWNLRTPDFNHSLPSTNVNIDDFSISTPLIAEMNGFWVEELSELDIPSNQTFRASLPISKKHKCEQCGSGFTRKDHLITHIRSMHEKEKHKCEQCESEFTRKGHLITHIKGVHQKKKHRCEQCGAEFTQKNNLAKHIKSMHGKEKHKCEQCGAEFTRKDNLITHIKGVHKKEKHKCEQCGEEFTRKGNLTRHIKKKHE